MDVYLEAAGNDAYPAGIEQLGNAMSWRWIYAPKKDALALSELV